MSGDEEDASFNAGMILGAILGLLFGVLFGLRLMDWIAG
jgi:hypothetical protein